MGKMTVYSILRWIGTRALPAPFKLFGVWMIHTWRRRLVGVFIDPVLGCNLRCCMCHFSDPAHESRLHGSISDEWLDTLEKFIFHRTLKLQIGCGAEPTLYPQLVALVTRGHRAGIPYISLTTNGQLIATGHVDLKALADAGLDELTLSLHGTSPEVYEHLMRGARFDRLKQLTHIIAEVRRTHPRLKLRVNFTINSLNITDLEGDKFWQLWSEDATPDIIQLRPVQKMGETVWTDFDLSPILEQYDTIIAAMAVEARRRGITFIAPDRRDIMDVNTIQNGASAVIEQLTYCYTDPKWIYKDDFIPGETYEQYHCRHHTSLKLLRSVFQSNKSRLRDTTKKLNYRIS